MATTTPNFGWAVPTSTDLVKDGAVAIETLGDSIDASLVDLKGGTTGQLLSKTTNTDMDFTWTTPAGGSSGLTKLVATTFSAVSSYSAPNSTFSATYNQYLIMVELTGQSASANIQMRLRASGTDATTDYQNQEITGSSTTAAATGGSGTFWDFGSSNTNTRFALKTDLYNPFGTGQHLQISEVFSLNSSSAWVRRALGGRLDISTSYDSFTLYPASGTITGRIAVYGYAL